MIVLSEERRITWQEIIRLGGRDGSLALEIELAMARGELPAGATLADIEMALRQDNVWQDRGKPSRWPVGNNNYYCFSGEIAYAEAD